MATAATTLLGYLRQMAGAALTADSDGVFLERFVVGHDERAFNALV